MKRTALVYFVAVLIGAASCVPIYWGDAAGYFDTSDPSAADEILVLVNRERQKNGFPPVAGDPVLSAIAQNHAEDMGRRGYFNHTSPEGKDLFERLAGAQVCYRRAAENIAWGYSSPTSLVRGWMNSSGHRKNILGDFTKAGVGLYRGYCVLVLIRE
jgi:uncharacterized protein YkwD